MQHGIRKVVPDKSTLEDAFRRAYHVAYVNQELDRLNEEAAEAAEGVKVPRGLENRIEGQLKKNPEMPWDKVLADIAETAVAESE